MTQDTTREILKRAEPNLTRAERQLCATILHNYPMSGLGSITRLAEKAGVSTPTVVRMVQKLGFSGFPAFQSALRDELEAQISGPIAKYDNWAEQAPETHLLNRFTEAVIDNIRQTLGQIDPAAFDQVVELLADKQRKLFIAGGRITHALSEYLFLHMQGIRPRVAQVPAHSNAWPHAVLDMEEGDVLVIYDIRRYENSALKLARIAAQRGVIVVLVTDQWQSPVAKHAGHIFNCRIGAPSAWDSTVAMMLLSETLIAAVDEAAWDRAKSRMKELEGLFDATKIFRKFV
ncbi:MAG TPA: MurR/RpiR family transcriptional regulator [Rhodobacteraceae bacterium]|nr:MurR/RpiR family transcriptional regulator [Paracoccaceae bacterium]